MLFNSCFIQSFLLEMDVVSQNGQRRWGYELICALVFLIFPHCAVKVLKLQLNYRDGDAAQNGVNHNDRDRHYHQATQSKSTLHNIDCTTSAYSNYPCNSLCSRDLLNSPHNLINKKPLLGISPRIPSSARASPRISSGGLRAVSEDTSRDANARESDRQLLMATCGVRASDARRTAIAGASYKGLLAAAAATPQHQHTPRSLFARRACRAALLDPPASYLRLHTSSRTRSP